MCLPVKPFKIEKEWEHAGLKCAVVQAREASHRCGYVRVPSTHMLYQKHYDDGLVDVQVHGGLTFAEQEPCTHEDGSGWWFGFDCAHSGDEMLDPLVTREQLSEATRSLYDIHKMYPDFHEHYWREHEVVAECESLAEQLAALA